MHEIIFTNRFYTAVHITVPRDRLGVPRKMSDICLDYAGRKILKTGRYFIYAYFKKYNNKIIFRELNYLSKGIYYIVKRKYLKLLVRNLSLSFHAQKFDTWSN